MTLDAYFQPSNLAASCVAVLMLVMFSIWVVLLVEAWVRHRDAMKLIEKTMDAGRALSNPTKGFHEAATAARRNPELPTDKERDDVFRAYLASKDLQTSNEIALHLKAIFEAGWSKSRLDARGLVRNTCDRLFRGNSLLRSVLSVFIILGVLGTLFGLSDTLVRLGESVQRASTFNEMLDDVKGVFDTLKSAFAPSILGVLLTALGLVLMSVYTRVTAGPLMVLLEHTTITNWIPTLMATPAQARLAVLQLEEEQAHRSAQAVEQAMKSAEVFRDKADELNDAMERADLRLRQMSEAASGLQEFSERFATGASALVSFQDELRQLYRQMASESQTFQASLRKNIEGSQEFQGNIQRQLDAQHEQLSALLNALKIYETAYLARREGMDEKLGELLVQAKNTFENLSRRNEELAQAMDAGVGKPLRENLEKNLGSVQQELQRQLGDIHVALLAQLKDIVQQLGALDGPINNAARGLGDTLSNLNENSRQWLDKIHREFAGQNETAQKQLRHAEVLATHLPDLVQGLTASSKDFSESSGNFASHGKVLKDHVTALSGDVKALCDAIVMLTGNLSRLAPGSVPPTSPPPRRSWLSRLMGGDASDA